MPPPLETLVECASCRRGNDCKSSPCCAICGRQRETVVVAWKCGSCSKTNEDMLHQHCHICGKQCPLHYLIVGGPIEPDCGGRWWYGRCAEPIDTEDSNVAGDGSLVKDDGNGYGKIMTKNKS